MSEQTIMINIQYQILRYLSDRVSGEFVNLGIVAFDPSSRCLKSKFITKIENTSRVFPNTNSRYLVRAAKTLQEELDRYSEMLITEFSFSKITSVEEITRTILPKDDSGLIFSEIKKTLDVSVDAVIADLYSRFVTISEADVDKIAKKIKREIEKHT